MLNENGYTATITSGLTTADVCIKKRFLKAQKMTFRYRTTGVEVYVDFEDVQAMEPCTALLEDGTETAGWKIDTFSGERYLVMGNIENSITEF